MRVAETLAKAKVWNMRIRIAQFNIVTRSLRAGTQDVEERPLMVPSVRAARFSVCVQIGVIAVRRRISKNLLHT